MIVVARIDENKSSTLESVEHPTAQGFISRASFRSKNKADKQPESIRLFLLLGSHIWTAAGGSICKSSPTGSRPNFSAYCIEVEFAAVCYDIRQ